MTSPPAAALTHLIAGQTGAHERHLARFDETQWQEYLDLLSGLFVLAVDRRFRNGDPSPVIRFVASVRERFDPAGTTIDPGVAETLMHAALGAHDTLPATAETIAQTMLVVALINDEGLSPTGLKHLLDETAEMLAATAVVTAVVTASVTTAVTTAVTVPEPPAADDGPDQPADATPDDRPTNPA